MSHVKGQRYLNMIKLHQLKKHPKSTHKRKVVGRGLGSGKGTYSTRGNKGQPSVPDTAKCRPTLKADASRWCASCRKPGVSAL